MENEVVDAIRHHYGTVADVAVGDEETLHITLTDGTSATWLLRRGTRAHLELSLAKSGILRSLPAVARAPQMLPVSLPDGDAILIHQPGQRLCDDAMTAEIAGQVVRTLAAMHSTFFGFPARLTATLGLAAPTTWLRDSAVPSTPDDGGDLATQLPDVASALERLRQQPAPLVEALREFPGTIIQGNPAPEYLARDGDAVLFADWSQALRLPGAVDLGVFLAAGWPFVTEMAEEIVEQYRTERARIGRLAAHGDEWHAELALGLLAALLRYGVRVRGDLSFWARVRDYIPA